VFVPLVTSDDIINGLTELGLKTGDQVIVHSSLKSFGYVEGGANTVIEAILSVIGCKGTILVPTNTFKGSVSVFLHSIKEVDLRAMPSLNGTISETVRLLSGSVRSIHPSHPVAAVGGMAEELLHEHHLGDTPAGEKSPYGKLSRMENGRILLIGVNNDSNTMIHTGEEYYAPYIFNGETYQVNVVPEKGPETCVTVKGYCIGVKRNFTVVDAFLAESGFMKKCKIGAANVSLISAQGLLKILCKMLKEDPYVLT
jgi:aminoglycoside 3-N-acetyltransferase